jgi:uncharacterized protein (TIGR03382 family)
MQRFVPSSGSVLLRLAIAAPLVCVASVALGQSYVRGPNNLAAIVYSSGPALTLEVGATQENVTLTDTPTDDAMYSIPGAVPYTLFSSNNSGGSNASVDTNGYVTWAARYPNSCGAMFANNPMAATGCRRHVMAAFWDDLLPVEGVSTITYGSTSGSFWYVQWNDFALFNNPSARLTFRLTHYQSGRIRINYISMSGTGSNGSGATVGVHSCNYPSRGSFRYAFTVFHNQPFLTSAPLAIDIARDNDRDHVAGYLDPNDNDIDSDDDTVTDGTELDEGTSPTNGGETPSLTDTDSDGLVDLDEAWFGSNVAVADSDNDGIEDGDEVFRTGTAVESADGDGDGWLDGDEEKNGDQSRDAALGESNPNDGNDIPGAPIGQSGGDTYWFQPSAVVDAGGNLHIASTGDTGAPAVGYWMLGPDGEVLISGTRFTPIDSDALYAHIAVSGTEVTIVYESLSAEPDDDGASRLGYIRFDVAGHPQDGTALTKHVSVATATAIGVMGAPRYIDLDVDSAGNAHVVYQDSGGTRLDGTPREKAVRYAVIAPDGRLVSNRTVVQYNRTGNSEGSNAGQNNGQGMDGWDGQSLRSNRGIHKHLTPEIAIDDNDVAHIVWRAIVAPSSHPEPYVKYAHSTFYARASNGAVTMGPAYLTHGRYERIDLAEADGLLYFTGSNGEMGESSQGIQFGVLDADAITLVPREGDQFGTRWAVSGGSFVTPISTVWTNDSNHCGAGVSVLPNGNAAITFSEGRGSDFGLLIVSRDGILLDGAFPTTSGQSDVQEFRHKPALAWNGGVGIVMGAWNLGDLRVGTVRGLANPNPPPMNRRPVITSLPPTELLTAGRSFSHQFTATDDATAAANLNWFFVAGPTNATMSAAGMLTWEPGSAQAGDWLFGVAACDEGNLCGEQFFVLTVQPGLDNYPPMITSTPPANAYVGRGFQYAVSVSDGDLPDDTFDYSITAPDPARGDMSISASGVFSWTPSDADVGVVAVRIQVADSSRLTTSQSFNVTVGPDTLSTPPGAPSIVIEDGGGCSATGATGLWSVALVALLGRRRKHA